MSNAIETILDFDSDTEKYCIDGGKCTHKCNGDCFREKFCEPLLDSGFDNDWNKVEFNTTMEIIG